MHQPQLGYTTEQVIGHTDAELLPAPDVGRVTARALRAQGYTVLDTDGPDAAIRLAREHTGPIDLLLTDVVMPGMSGRDLADALLAAHPHLRYLFMSGYPAGAGPGQETEMDVAHFLAKPLALASLAALAAKLREVLDRA